MGFCIITFLSKNPDFGVNYDGLISAPLQG
jgi:hypothetical protein